MTNNRPNDDPQPASEETTRSQPEPDDGRDNASGNAINDGGSAESDGSGGDSGSESPPPPKPPIFSIKNAKTIFTSAYLVALYTIAIYLAVMTLAIHQIHQKTAKLQETNEEVHFWLLKEASDYYREIPDDTVQPEINTKLDEKILDLTSQHITSQLEASKARSQFDEFSDNILGPNGNLKLKEENPTNWMVPRTKYIFAVKYSQDDTQTSELEKAYKEHLKSYSNNEVIKKELSGLKELKKIKNQQIENSIKRKEKKEERTISHIKKYIGNKDETKANRIFILAMEFKSLEDRFCFFDNSICLFKSLPTTRTEFLTLILVLIMGMVGGLIHLTQDYLSNNHQATAAYYVFRPVLGILAAFATFILVKAGVLAVSGSTQVNGQDAPLSPFFVSFLGIISGLMAQASIRNVQVAARSFFRPSNLATRSRWARADATINVKELADKAAPETKERLRDTLDESDGILNDWLSGRHPTPIHAQQAIAIWLNRDIRDLFHDTPSHQQAQ